MKRPAFQFYPADWRKDVELRSCSIAARGLWIDMLCIAHECEPYGHLTINGRPMNAGQIAGQVGLTKQQCEALLVELVDNGVARKTEAGVIFSKRMVDDEDLRNRRAEGGKAGSAHGVKGAESGIKGGRPQAGRGVMKPPLDPPLDGALKPPPSSSSSSSSSEDLEHAQSLRERLEAEGFEPTRPGLLCRAMREKAGFTSTNPGDPRFTALVEQGITEAECVGMAAECVAKGKGWGWFLDVLPKRRADAAAIALAPRVEDKAGAEAAAQSVAYLAEQAAAAAAARTPEAQAARRAAMAKVGRAAA